MKFVIYLLFQQKEAGNADKLWDFRVQKETGGSEFWASVTHLAAYIRVKQSAGFISARVVPVRSRLSS